MTVLGFHNNCANFCLMSSTFTSLVVSCVPPNDEYCVDCFRFFVASSFICPISAREALAFLGIFEGLPWDVVPMRTSLTRLFPTSSVTACGLPSLASAFERLLVAVMSSCRPLISWCCSLIKVTSCWFDRSSLMTNDSSQDVFSNSRSTAYDRTCRTKFLQCTYRFHLHTPSADFLS